jgi:gamma-glutamyltranspeptidase / glutathione hydrolase
MTPVHGGADTPACITRPVLLLVLLASSLETNSVAAAADLSPRHWPEAQRAAAEKAEVTAPAPQTNRVVIGKSGLVVSTLSPIAALAGVETLKHGGNAADAAVATALTQITTALGANISFAGILEVAYYDAKSRRTYSLNAGWNAWSGETDRASIAPSPMMSGMLAPQGGPPQSGDLPGRRTLVPGFMAGIEALHGKFGKLELANLLAPAIFYAERGVTISPSLAGYFTVSSRYLAATSSGRRFMQQSGSELPRVGDRFAQSDLASTLRAVAQRGAPEMYSGAWGRDFVAAVAAAGGKASLGDMTRYHVQWSEPARGTFQGHEIRISSSAMGGQSILEALALFENTGLVKQPSYQNNAESLLSLSRILTWSTIAPNYPAALDAFRAAGVDVSLAGRLTPAYANAVTPALRALFVAAPGGTAPVTTPHSASVVVVDAQGNVASLVHTSNTLAWGSTGLVVGGVPIPEAAGLTATRFPAVKPGGRIPHDMAPLITFKDGRPVLAVATVGSSLVQESVKVMLSFVSGRDVATALAAPPLLLSTAQPQPGGAPVLALQVPAGAYEAKLVAQPRAQGITVKECAPAEVIALRGTPAVARIDGAASSTAEVQGVFNFALGY